MSTSLSNFFSRTRRQLAAIYRRDTPQHKCRVVSIEKDKTDNYIAVIQLINKSQTIKIKPEEILADDNFTDCFSQRDIRTLTYLGYLGINSPKYKILAKRLSETDNKLLFAIHERGSATPLIKTADEISTDDDIINSLPQKDAHMVGYVSANERNALEAEQKKNLLIDEKK